MPSIFDSVSAQPGGRPATEAECFVDPFFSDCFPIPGRPEPPPPKTPEEYAAAYLASVPDPDAEQRKWAHLLGFFSEEYGKRPASDSVFDRVTGMSVRLKDIRRAREFGKYLPELY